MGSPFDHRQLMRASFRFGETRSVEEVSAAISARHGRHGGSSGSSTSRKRSQVARSGETIPSSVVDDLKALVQRGHDLRAANG